MLYTILKFVHVIAIAIWFGGIVTMLILNRLLVAKGESAAMQGLGRIGAILSKTLFMPAVGVTLLTGLGMVHVGDLDYGALWISWGMGGLVASFVIGGVFTGGAARKLGQAVARGEIDAAGIAAAQRRILIFAVTNVLILLSIIFVMVAKP